MTSKAYILEGTALKFNGHTSADVAFSMEGVVDGAGRVSAQKDLGSAARAPEYEWYCEALLQATPIQGDVIELYAAGAPGNDSAMISGDVGTTDAALGDIDQVRNLQFLGVLVAEEADTTKMVGRGRFEWSSRYLTIVGKNETGATINATDTNFIFNLTPIYIQGQDT